MPHLACTDSGAGARQGDWEPGPAAGGERAPVRSAADPDGARSSLPDHLQDGRPDRSSDRPVWRPRGVGGCVVYPAHREAHLPAGREWGGQNHARRTSGTGWGLRQARQRSPDRLLLPEPRVTRPGADGIGKCPRGFPPAGTRGTFDPRQSVDQWGCGTETCAGTFRRRTRESCACPPACLRL